MIKEETKELLKFNAHGVAPKAMFQEACDKAREVATEYVEKHGEPMYCGFASVTIYPARGRLVKWLRDNGIGNNGYRGGWRISSYDVIKGHPYCSTQSLDIKETACDAFCDVLKKYGIEAYAEGRAD
jgi:hypothetical protein